MNSYKFYAMGCEMRVWGCAPDLSAVAEIFESAENRFSRFRPHSELSQLNNQPERWVSVSAEMWRILQRTRDLSEATNGLFDPTLLSALEHAGYDRPFDEISMRPTNECLGSCNSPNTHLRGIAFDDLNRAVYLQEGARLDLGGIAKGDTAQQAVDWLRQFGACLVDASGDLVAGDAPDRLPGWAVGVAAPFLGEENLLRMWLANRTLATSGIDRRRWPRGAGMKHHIIDPDTGDSAETDLLSASIWHNDASTAEAYATAALILGLDAAYDFLTERMIGAALVDRFGRLLLTPALSPFVQLDPNTTVIERKIDLSPI